eukprot:GFKZ01011989.1.p1 GENE.GFKZ01011989.1~~GFKZ01011989.1.p1  ORF type:complete len:283 (+),score=32.60 GFKZ01011989.1:590-1438(+)
MSSTLFLYFHVLLLNLVPCILYAHPAPSPLPMPNLSLGNVTSLPPNAHLSIAQQIILTTEILTSPQPSDDILIDPSPFQSEQLIPTSRFILTPSRKFPLAPPRETIVSTAATIPPSPSVSAQPSRTPQTPSLLPQTVMETTSIPTQLSQTPRPPQVPETISGSAISGNFDGIQSSTTTLRTVVSVAIVVGIVFVITVAAIAVASCTPYQRFETGASFSTESLAFESNSSTAKAISGQTSSQPGSRRYAARSLERDVVRTQQEAADLFRLDDVGNGGVDRCDS